MNEKSRVIKIKEEKVIKFDFDAFLKKEDITLYGFCDISKTSFSSVYRMCNGERGTTKSYFDLMMGRYKDGKMNLKNAKKKFEEEGKQFN